MIRLLSYLETQIEGWMNPNKLYLGGEIFNYNSFNAFYN